MQTITKKREIKKWVSAGFEDEKIFITEDGLEFADKKEAQRHEGKIISEKSFTTKYNVRQLTEYEAIYIKELNDNTKKEILDHYPHGQYCSSLNPAILVVGWNLIEIDDSGDYTCVQAHNLNNEIEYRLNDLKELEGLRDTKYEFSSRLYRRSRA
jgi:hypothetical protein